MPDLQYFVDSLLLCLGFDLDLRLRSLNPRLCYFHLSIEDDSLLVLVRLESADLLLLAFHHLQELMQVHVFENFEFPSLQLQLIEPFALVEPILNQLLLFPALGLDVIFEPLDDLLLSGDLVLTPLQLLLQYFLTLLCLCKWSRPVLRPKSTSTGLRHLDNSHARQPDI